ncbi:MAG: hypothetical protein IJ480_04285 [Clostridia bacterium]|nr:hypothetical protein [Clostridia bacterium]
MLKFRITCVGLAVVCLAGLGITLYLPETPNLTAAYFFACTCIGALVGNAVFSVMELHRAKKEMRTGKKDETASENRL